MIILKLNIFKKSPIWGGGKSSHFEVFTGIKRNLSNNFVCFNFAN